MHVDEFLYDDDDMNELIDNGKLQKYYCIDCGSRDIKPLSKLIILASLPSIKLF